LYVAYVILEHVYKNTLFFFHNGFTVPWTDMKMSFIYILIQYQPTILWPIIPNIKPLILSLLTI